MFYYFVLHNFVESLRNEYRKGLTSVESYKVPTNSVNAMIHLYECLSDNVLPCLNVFRNRQNMDLKIHNRFKLRLSRYKQKMRHTNRKL
jgi:hypothetical protein